MHKLPSNTDLKKNLTNYSVISSTFPLQAAVTGASHGESTPAPCLHVDIWQMTSQQISDGTTWKHSKCLVLFLFVAAIQLKACHDDRWCKAITALKRGKGGGGPRLPATHLCAWLAVCNWNDSLFFFFVRFFKMRQYYLVPAKLVGTGGGTQALRCLHWEHILRRGGGEI